MQKKTRKPAVKTTKNPKTQTKKQVSEKVSEKVTDNVETLKAKITKLESAYIAAISGKMKFGQVKSIFKKIHKEIKQDNKK